jgi:hypothetical protein
MEIIEVDVDQQGINFEGMAAIALPSLDATLSIRA